MTSKFRYFYLLLVVYLPGCAGKKSQGPDKPNVVIVYADDLGYGDLSCYGAKAVKTPYIDSLASQGLLFTDAHCSASTCTPSRFALLTGSYAFRNDAAILPGDAPLIIDENSETMADMFRKAGYATGVIGKWHLGLGDGRPDWNAAIKPGPAEIGFDYSYLIPATADRVPTVFVEDQRVVNLDPSDPIQVSYERKTGNDPDGLRNPELLKMKADSQHSGTIVNGISRIGFMSGGHGAYWKDEDFALVLTGKIRSFILDHSDRPFFLYYALPGIHVPRAPNSRFKGATKMGPRGDDIVQLDWMVGQLMVALREAGQERNTLVIFSSDNGPVLDDGYVDRAAELVGEHKPASIYKGGKYSVYEGGTRVPTIVWWPGKVPSGRSDALLSHVDLFASLAKLTGQDTLAPGTAPDSREMLPVLLGGSRSGREEMVEEAFTMALRSGQWKYIEPASKKTPDWLKNKDVATGLMSGEQLYYLQSDPGEQYNLAKKYPERVKHLKERLRRIKEGPTGPAPAKR